MAHRRIIFRADGGYDIYDYRPGELRIDAQRSAAHGAREDRRNQHNLAADSICFRARAAAGCAAATADSTVQSRGLYLRGSEIYQPSLLPYEDRTVAGPRSCGEIISRTDGAGSHHPGT